MWAENHCVSSQSETVDILIAPQRLNRLQMAFAAVGKRTLGELFNLSPHFFEGASRLLQHALLIYQDELGIPLPPSRCSVGEIDARGAPQSMKVREKN